MKANILKIVCALVFLVLFNVLFFALGGMEQSRTNWITYGFIHVAYLMILLTPLFAPKGNGLVVLMGSLYLRSLFYFFTELVIGLLCMAVSPESALWPFVIQSVVFAIFLVLQLMSAVANIATESSMLKQRAGSAFIKTLALQVNSACRTLEDKSLRDSVIRCYDALNNSSVETFPDAEGAELALRSAIEKLCSAIGRNDSDEILTESKSVLDAVRTRNDVIKRCRMNR